MKQNRSIWQEVSRLYEQRLAEAVGEMLNSERFANAVQKVLTTSEDFRKLVIRGIETAMSNLELPTGQDFARLYRMLDGLDDALFGIRSDLHELRKNDFNRLDGRLDELEDRLARMEKQLAALSPEKKPAPAKPGRPKGGGAKKERSTKGKAAKKA